MPVRIKVCCVSSTEEARAAVAAGASAVGLVSAMPSGPGVIEESLIAEIAAVVPPGVTRVLLTSSADPAAVASQQRRTKVDAIQLVDRWDRATREDLRAALPGVRLIQVVHVTGTEAVDEAVDAAGGADALLLDSGRPDAAARELGGTGRVHDWETSRRIRDSVEVPVFLAGGLTADNVAEAVRRVEPYGVDVCTGVRREGRLDADRLEAFVRAVAG